MERDGLWGSSDEDGDNLAQFMAGSGDYREVCAVSCDLGRVNISTAMRRL